MQNIEMVEWLALIALGLICAQAAITFIRPRPETDRSGPSRTVANVDDAVFLFEDGILMDSTPAANALLPTGDAESDWQSLHSALVTRFSRFPKNWEGAVRSGQVLLRADDPADPADLVFESLNGVTRVQFRPYPEFEGPGTSDCKTISALRDELQTHRMAADASPFPAWQLTDNGEVGWYNAAYAGLYQDLHGTMPKPDKPILQTLLDSRTENGTVRSSVIAPGSEQTLWFDVTVIRHERFSMYYAQDVNTIVNAEVAQRNFVQTLAKTFAQLSIGLAIFDRNRQLVLFNPALIDLTTLPADFLSGRPNLLTFFDRLRDNRMMPEPKNYGSWRDEMADLVAAAADGRYLETWSLPSGSVYQVSGKPHPDGAVAFLFEDITAEVTLTRRFRSDVELGQSILDNLESPLAIFSSTGVLTFSNTAYCKLWSVDPERSFAEVTIHDAARDWHAKCGNSALWDRVRDSVLIPENREPWQSHFSQPNGGVMDCKLRPVTTGATLIVFSPATRETEDTLTGLPAAMTVG